MTLPATSFKRQADVSGTDFATETISSKAYQVFMEAGSQGHLKGTRDSFILIVTPTATSVALANKLHLDLFNATGSGKTVYVHGIWVNTNLDIANAIVIGLRIDLFRTTSVGVVGTGATIATEVTAATNTITMINPPGGGPNLPAQITARVAPSGGGAASGAFLGQAYFATEETHTSLAYMTQWQNMMRYSGIDDMSDLVVKENSGIKLVQGPTALGTVQLGFRIAFSLA